MNFPGSFIAQSLNITYLDCPNTEHTREGIFNDFDKAFNDTIPVVGATYSFI